MADEKNLTIDTEIDYDAADAETDIAPSKDKVISQMEDLGLPPSYIASTQGTSPINLPVNAVTRIETQPLSVATPSTDPKFEGLFAPADPTSFDPAKDVTREYEPIMIPYANTGFLGTGYKSEVTVDYKWYLTDPDVSVSEVLDFKDQSVLDLWNRTTKLIDVNGNPINVTGRTVAQKVQLADKFGAVKYIVPKKGYGENNEREFVIPWDKAITRFTQTPETFGLDTDNLTMSQVNRSMFYNRLFSTLANADFEYGKSLYAKGVNTMLIERGIDARARYLILNKMDKGYGVDEAKRMTNTFLRNTAGFVVETALWGGGETIGWFASQITPEKYDMASTYQTRGDIMESIWLSAEENLIYWAADNNIEMDLETASAVVNHYTGYGTRSAVLAAEVLAPTKGSVLGQVGKSKTDLFDFKQFKKKMLDKNEKARQEDPNIKALTEADINRLWIQEKTPEGMAYYITNPEARLTRAYQIDDSLLPPAWRAEVIQAKATITRLEKRRESLQERIRLNPGNPDLVEKLRTTNLQIAPLLLRLSNTEKRSSIPKFVRDQNIQDQYIIGGAIAGSIFVGEVFDGDPALGEIIGLGAGITLSMSKGAIASGLNEITGRYTTNTRKKAAYLVRKMQTYSPEVQMGMERRAVLMDSYQQELINLGVDEELLDVTVPILTDLVTMRHFLGQIQETLSVSGSLDKAATEQLQLAKQAELILNSQLNDILGRYGGVGNQAQEDFLKMVKTSVTTLEETRTEINDLLDIVDRKGVGHYMGIIMGKPSSHTGDQDIAGASVTFPDAMDNLIERGAMDAIDEKSVVNEVVQASKFVNEQLEGAANNIVKELNDRDSARSQAVDVLPTTEKLPDVPQYTSPSGLFAFQMETNHAVQKAEAQAPYKFLESDNVVYMTADQAEISGIPLTDATPIFTSILDIRLPGTKQAIAKARGDKITDAEFNAMLNVAAEISNPLFESIAASRSISKKEAIDAMKEAVMATGYTFRSKSLEGIQGEIIIELAKNRPDLLQISPSELRNLDSVIAGLRFKYADMPEVSQSFENVSGVIEEQAKNFAVDGVNVGQILVSGKGMPPVSFQEYVDRANKGWSQYKSVWYDKTNRGIAAQFMSWGTRTNAGGATQKYPTNIKYKSLPETWLDIERLATDDAYAKNWFASIEEAVGDLTINEQGVATRAFTEGGENTRVFTSIVKAALSEFLIERFPNMSPKDRNDFLRKFNRNFTMLPSEKVRPSLPEPQLIQTRPSMDGDIPIVQPQIDVQPIEIQTGKIPLFSTDTLMDNVRPFNSTSIGQETYTDAMKVAEDRIQNKLVEATEVGRTKVKAINDAIDIIQNVTGKPGSFDFIVVSNALISGGREQYTDIRRAIIDSKIQEGLSPDIAAQQTDRVLSDLFMLSIQKRGFIEGPKKVTVKDADRGIYEEKNQVFSDGQQLFEALGRTDEERAVAKQILGPERYSMINAMAGFLSEVSNDTISGVPRATGIPRGLSVESLISRVYAINRNVVSPKYVGTEALIQSLRQKNFNFLIGAIEDPELGKLMLEMLRTNKPLDPVRNAKFESLLLQAFMQSSQQAQQTEVREVVDPLKRTFKVSITSLPQSKQQEVADKQQRFLSGGVQQKQDGTLIIPSLNVP